MSIEAPSGGIRDDADRAVAATREIRLLGLAIGLAVGPAGGFVQSWSGNADGRWHVWLLMSALGALLGAASLPVFKTAGARDARQAFGLGFLMLFGFCVAVVAGTFAAFPVGASMGAVGGVMAGLVAGLVWRVDRLSASRWRWPIAALAASGAGLLLVFVWTSA